PDAVHSGRKELSFSKYPIYLLRGPSATDPGDREQYGVSEDQPQHGGDEDEGHHFDPALGFQYPANSVKSRHSSATITAHQGVRGAGRKPSVPSDDVPGDRPEKPAKQYPQLPLRINLLDVDHVGCDGL